MNDSPTVFGQVIDHETRCVHYHSDKDVIAIKFYCCDTYYPCYQCHNNACNHAIKRWPATLFTHKAILCGHCGSEFSIQTYLNAPFLCRTCQHPWNEGCAFHYHLYFEA
ncbi:MULTISPECIES: CHY zinc finger protein [Pontibacillus]|uniref:CHY zinc finger protein n=1 Tax=Pontibacillus chungwhensis TaxID=265426 RepID=A0ABY8UT73_9BACI|nr:MULTISPECIES: CHY zinc finger protein [Pontibacillus]MCD5323142.1 CHY zinc finger protein [Pontibacillus sp. HN14]WIF96530.1 CHY zinc finger protein [Pontibacillus chungwhensis]